MAMLPQQCVGQTAAATSSLHCHAAVSGVVTCKVTKSQHSRRAGDHNIGRAEQNADPYGTLT